MSRVHIELGRDQKVARSSRKIRLSTNGGSRRYDRRSDTICSSEWHLRVFWVQFVYVRGPYAPSERVYKRASVLQIQEQRVNVVRDSLDKQQKKSRTYFCSSGSI